MHGRKKIIIYILISIIGLFWLSGCDSPSSDSGNTESKAEAEAQNGLIYKSSMKLLYAKNFSVDYYEGGYKIRQRTVPKYLPCQRAERLQRILTRISLY